MRKQRFTTLLLTAIMLVGAGCSSEQTNSAPTSKRVTTAIPQTGSMVGRRVEVPDSDEALEDNQPAKKKQAKAKRKSAQASEDIVTRDGFR